MWVSILLLFQLQAQMDPVRPSDVARLQRERQERAIESQQRDYDVRNKRGFEERFNKLVKALEEFTHDYNGGTGHVWPRKKAFAVQKAMKALQSSSAWKQGSSEN